MTNNLSIIILAAGKGSRMKSDLPKVLHKITNREMLNLVIDEAKILNPKNITIVVSPEMKNFEEKIIQAHFPNLSDNKISFALQKQRHGTAHAVSTGLENLNDLGEKLLILYGDTPLTSHVTMQKMVEKLDEFSLCILGFDDEEENAYGRLIVDNEGHLEKIVEFKDATAEEKKIALCNSGVMAVAGKQIKNLLSKVKNNNAAAEFYLTDIVAIASEIGLKRTFIKTRIEEVLGVNSRAELAKLENIKQNQIRKNMMDSGVTMLDPNSVYFSFDTKIASDVIIHPQVFFGPEVKIENDVEIKSFCHIEGAEIACGAVVGPFARIRPQTKISQNVRIGNFIEIKKSHLKKGAKVNHLSYIGDAEIGENSNIGAGTITCNFDGHNKFKTEIGDNVFIGSNSALIAPIKIENGAVIGAGSVISKSVATNELAVSRAKQINIADGATKFHNNKMQNKTGKKKHE
ncbi:MAG: bifunctional UDP-N-acetylglucosamine diphosphorylase/glucosamine-1-phosphate N-acetyltransferase GlmU [Rickettsiales bacterium]|nr:bifunctional UDP-N-acetylglucosamine diphosphorylase/glucosamine-1-phosphate N-acetyltransferase GlmU [Rickettsiales bacterium]